MRARKNGIVLVECATFGFISLRRADLYACPVCGFELVTGAAGQFYGHWEGDIVKEVRRLEERGERIVLCWLNQGEKETFLRRGKRLLAKAEGRS
jgi:uncharacterized protein YndB with AHSA1/START domain